MTRRSTVTVALVCALLVGAACGDEASEPVSPQPVERTSGGVPADLVGRWRALQPGGFELAYFFHPDGTYTHSSELRQKRPGGTYSFRVEAEGTFEVRGLSLELHPRRGTQEVRDPNREGVRSRPLEKRRQRYTWSVRGSGKRARLTMAIGGGLAVTYKRQ